MKKLSFCLLILSLIALSSCNDDGLLLNCGENITAENTDWFNELAASLDTDVPGMAGTWYIQSARYETQTVFIPHSCCPAFSYIAQVYNCQGEIIGTLGTSGGNINPNDLRDIEVVWRASNFVCTN